MFNQSFIFSKTDFQRTIKKYIENLARVLSKEEKYLIIRELFEYMILDNHWLCNEYFKQFVICTKLKLKELSKENPEYKEYFHDVEERLGFARYCKGININYNRCSNHPVKGSDLCNVHEQRFNYILNCVLEVVPVKDLANMITNKSI